MKTQSLIKSIKSRKILDSREKPTIEVNVITDSGNFLASVPSGTSKGKYEAVEKEVDIAVKNVNKIITPKLKGKDPCQQKEIDNLLIKLDGTKRKSRLGVNAILGVSMAVCRAGAKVKRLPLWKWISEISKSRPSFPTPLVLFIEGGLHGRKGLDFQEFMVTFPAKTFKEKFKIANNFYYKLGRFLEKKYGEKANNLGMEGAFIPPIKKTKEVLDLLIEIGGKKINIIIDAAASSLFRKGKYIFEGKKINSRELLNFYLEICKNYPIMAIEDPFAEDDWQWWQELNLGIKILNRKTLIIGDDLTVTNPERIKKAHKEKSCRGVIIKPNQIGTISETIEAAKLAKSYNWKTIVSHRSGETQDDFIADFAVGIGADYIKAGAPSKIERMVKYKRLLEIEKEIHPVKFAFATI